MFLSKKGLEVSRAAASDDPRFGINGRINGIRVESDGRTVGTNGHWLAIWTPAGMPDAADAPKIEGVEVNGTELEPFTLPVDAAKQIAKAIPKGRALPVLQYAQLDAKATNENGHAVIGVTDLESPQVFRPAKVESTFPKYENVIPDGSADLETVTLDVAYLGQIAAMLKAQGCKAVSVTFQKRDEEKPLPDNAYPGQKRQKPTAKPVVFNAKGDDGTAKVVLMPMVD